MYHNEEKFERIELVEKTITEHELYLPGDAILQEYVTWEAS